MSEQVDLSVNVAGIEMANPVIAASGTFGFGEEFSRIEGFRNADLGAIVLKATTLEPRDGNPTPRIAETPAGILNSVGLQNPGLDVVVNEILPTLEGYGPKIIANVAGKTEDEYLRVVEGLSASAVLAGLEINISCPNVKEGGMSFGADPKVAARLTKKIKALTSLPVIMKLTPNVTDITDVARACIDAGADALSLINTVSGMAIDLKTKRPILGANQGGLSGPAIKPVALLRVHQVYRVAGGVPVIGMGGIASWQDAAEFILAGASAVSIGTSMFWNHEMPRRIIDGLAAWVADEGETSIRSLVGKLKMNG